MKRQRALVALSILLVLSVVVAGFPLADFFGTLDREDQADSPLHGVSPDGSGSTSSPGDVASGDVGPGRDGASPGALGIPGPLQSATGVEELSRLLKDAGGLLAGRPIATPALETQIPAVDPLPAALVKWVAVTGSNVPEAEMQQALADARALPQAVQLDLAKLVFAAAEATLLQRSALAGLTPADIEFLETHPEAAAALLQGRVEDEDAARVLELSRKVDVAKSTEATLLLLAAVDDVRDRLKAYAPDATSEAASTDEVREVLKPFPGALDVIDALAALDAGALTSQGKLRVAGDLLAAASGVSPEDDPRPFAPLDPDVLARDGSLPIAIAALFGASWPEAPQEIADLLAPDLARSNALPEDLQDALARVLLARAEGIAASRLAVLGPDPVEAVARADAVATLKTLSAIEQALPVLEKYSILWGETTAVDRLGPARPDVAYADALRRAAAVEGSTGSLESALRAAGATLGVRAGPVIRDDLTFTQAFARLARAGGASPTPAELEGVTQIGAALDSNVRHAATVLMIAQVDASEAANAAFACLSASEMAFLRERADDVRAISASTAPVTAADLTLLAQYAELAGCIDAQKLLDAGVVLAAASDEARRLLDAAAAGGAPVTTQSADADEAPRGLRAILDRLARLLPFGTARAQSGAGEVFGCPASPVLPGLQDCSRGYILQFPIPGIYILDATSTGILAGDAAQDSAIFVLDLGGDDTYTVGTAGIGECVNFFEPSQPLLAAVHFEYEGDDRYVAPDSCTKTGDVTITWRGSLGAGFTGIGLLVDNAGTDYYRALSHTQGYAWQGVGVLADFGSGGDQYVSRFAAQGATYGGFGFSLGLLLDQGGADRYSVDTRVSGSYQSQAWGLGGFLVDTGGDDRYDPTTAKPMGVDATAYVNLGSSGRLLATRDDNRVWVDGPKVAGLVQKGVGVDVEIDLANPDGDFDGMPTLLETLLGSDATDPGSSYTDALDASTSEQRRDTDGDGFPDVVEVSLGTDPKDPQEAPAKLPAELATALAPAFRALFPSNASAENLTLPDKYLDVRVPFPGSGAHLGPFCDAYAAWAFPATFLGERIVAVGNTFSGQGSDGGQASTDMFYYGIVHPNLMGTGLEGVAEAVYLAAASFLPDSVTVPGASLGAFAPVGGPNAQPYNQPTACSSKVADTPAGALVSGGGNTTFSNNGRIFHGGADDPNNPDGSDSLALTVPPGLFALGDVIATRYEIDYLVSIDLGGADSYLNRAGGAGGVLLESHGTGTDAAATFMPTGLLAVDLGQPDTPEAADAYTAPRAAGGVSLAHGAGGGILIDTAGADRYVAGSHSQGALAGLLLDFSGDDRYSATDRSQGAAFVPGLSTEAPGANDESRAVERARHLLAARPSVLLDFGGADAYQAWNRSQGHARGLLNVDDEASRASGVMAETLGLLADLGGADAYRALGRFSQGVARGGASGVLVDPQGDDRYEARDATSQGAIEPAGLAPATTPSGPATTDLGGLGGVFDFAGRDVYRVFRDSGVLDRTAKRQNNLTFLPITAADARMTGTALDGVYANLGPAAEPVRIVSGAGVHADVEGSDKDSDSDGTPDFLEAFAGTNWAEAGDAPSSGDLEGWILHLPTARLAIGGRGAQVYDRDYAFALDFGGENVHRSNAAGPVLAVPLVDGGSSQARLLLSAFPVTFTYEVANAATRYEAARDLVQGVGYFTVGVVVDEGGADSFATPRDARHILPSRFTARVPSLNGVIDATEWKQSANLTGSRALALESRLAPGSERAVELFVMNDLDRIYVALRYRPDALSFEGDPSKSDEETKALKNNWAKISFDSDHDHVAVEASPLAPDCAAVTEKVAAGVDGVEIAGTTDAAGRPITYFNDTWLRATAPSPAPRAWMKDCASRTLDDVDNQDIVGRRTYRDGVITIEFSKPLSSGDRQDLDVAADGLGGFTIADLGFQIEIGDRITGETFAWPPGSARDDGVGDALEDGEFAEELETWSVLRLAGSDPANQATITQKASWDLGENATRVPLAGVVGARLAPHGHSRAIAQGAGLGGVGVLAMLGGAQSSAVYAADEYAQGFGAFGGLGLLLDAGGSDRYHGVSFTQGAQALTGVGAFVDLEGNDEYNALAYSQGFGFTAKELLGSSSPQAPAGDGVVVYRNAGSAVFLDAGGDDVYRYGMESSRMTLTAKHYPSRVGVAEVDDLVCPPEPGASGPCSRDVEADLADPKTATFNDRAWTQGQQYSTEALAGRLFTISHGGLGIDYRAEREFVREVSSLYEDLTWNPHVKLVVGQEVRSPNGAVTCATAPSQIIAGITRYAVNGTACVRAFVYFRNYQGGFYHPIPPGLTVDRLDVLVGDRILARLQDGVRTSAASFGLRVTPNPTAPNDIEHNYPGMEFEVRGWDTRLVDDGPFPLRGQVFYSTTWDSMGLAWLKTTEDSCVGFVCAPPSSSDPTPYPALDQGQGAFTPHRVVFMTEESAGVLLDNAPHVVATATPSLAGQAAFSPNAVALPDTLTVEWAPSHDIVEDRFPLVGYYPSEQNVECPDDAGALCHVLPFYMWHDVTSENCANCQQPPLLNTYPTSPDASADGLPSQLDHGSLKYWYLNNLGQPIELEPGYTLNLRLFRTAIVQAEYETFLTLRSTKTPSKSYTFSDKVPEPIGIVPAADPEAINTITQTVADAITSALENLPSADDARDSRCKARYPATVGDLTPVDVPAIDATPMPLRRQNGNTVVEQACLVPYDPWDYMFVGDGLARECNKNTIGGMGRVCGTEEGLGQSGVFAANIWSMFRQVRKIYTTGDGDVPLLYTTNTNVIGVLNNPYLNVPPVPPNTIPTDPLDVFDTPSEGGTAGRVTVQVPVHGGTTLTIPYRLVRGVNHCYNQTAFADCMTSDPLGDSAGSSGASGTGAPAPASGAPDASGGASTSTADAGGDATPEAQGDGWNDLRFYVPNGLRFEAGDTIRVELTTRYTGSYLDTLEKGMTPICQSVRAAYEENVRDSELRDDVYETTPDWPQDPVFGGYVFPGDSDNFLRDRVDANTFGSQTLDSNTKNCPPVLRPNDLDLPEYLLYYGTESYPSRLEFIVRADPATRVPVDAVLFGRDDKGNRTNEVLFQQSVQSSLPRFAGDAEACEIGGAACQILPWTGTVTGGSAPVPDGRYVLRFSPRTVSAASIPGHPLDGLAKGRVGPTLDLPVLVDATPPVTTMDMPQTDALKGTMRTVLGRGHLTSGTQFAITWKATDPGAAAPTFSGAGVNQSAVWLVPSANGSIPNFDPATWTNLTGDHVPAGRREARYAPQGGVTTFYVGVVSRDRVGNVEGLPDGWSSPLCAPALVATERGAKACIERAFRAALQEKVNRSREDPDDPLGLFRIDLDLSSPLLVGGSIGGPGAHRGLVNGIPRTIVRAGDPVTFRVCTADGAGESGVSNVNVYFVSVASESVETETRAMADLGGGCWTYDAWGSENADKTAFPDGLWAVGFEAFDRGANRVEAALDEIFLDSEAPVVTRAVLKLPEGQTAVKPGDRIDVHIQVTDNTAVNESATVVDAPGLTVAGPTPVVRSTLENVTYQATLKVDKAGLVNGVVPVEWTVADVAGNVVSGTLLVTVDVKDFEFVANSVKVTKVTYDSITLEWETTEPTIAKVAYGFGPFELRKSTATTEAYSKKNVVTVKDLQASTRYFLKAVSVSEGGVVHESTVLDAQTLTALYLESLGLRPRDAVSGEYNLSWTGGLRAGLGTPKFSLHVRAGDGPWEFLTAVSRGGSDHHLVVNTTRLLDGSRYSFRLTAESGRDAVNVTVGPVVVDNTRPVLTLTSSATATREITPRFAGVVADGLSGVDPKGLRLTIDGKAVDPARFLVTNGTVEGEIAFEITVPEPLALGPHAVVLSAADRAGATATKAFTLAIDLETPSLAAAPVGYFPGPSAARRDATVVLNVTVVDATGVESVTANLTGLVTAKPLRAFERVGATNVWRLEFTLDAPEKDGAHPVRIVAVDPAGNAESRVIDVIVDTTPPSVARAVAQDASFTTARVIATANEPVILEVSYTAESSAGTASAASASKEPVVELKGLLPSRTYTFIATATDAAGNAAVVTGAFATAKDTRAPSQVLDVKVIDLKDGRLRVEWSAAKDDVAVAHYRVYRAGPGESFAIVGEPTTAHFEEQGLPLEAPFTYKVSAVDFGKNEGPVSGEVTGKSTTPPRLTGGLVTPTLGSARSTTFLFRVQYVSAGGVAPTYVRAIIDGVPHDMRQVEGADAKTGLTFEYATALGATTLDRPHTYQFEASDGRYVVKFPRDEPVKGPLVSGDSLADRASGIVNFAKQVPLVGAGAALLAVAAAALVLVRRRK